MRGVRILLCLLALLPLLATLSVGHAASAEPPAWGAALVAGQAPAGSPLSDCIELAQSTQPQAWTCLGGVLTATSTGPTGAVTTRTTTVPGAERVAWRTAWRPPRYGRSGAEPAGVIGPADDYDTWCESGTICGRQLSDYVAEVKGNAAYGDRDGVIGTFDQVLRQSFDGGRPRWRALLDWDSGPSVNGRSFSVDCRQSDALKDSRCGTHPWDPPAISGSKQRTWLPSQSGYIENARSLSGSKNKYHDDYQGEFTAAGHQLVFSTGTLHTGRWTGCSSCTYYQVPWRPAP